MRYLQEPLNALLIKQILDLAKLHHEELKQTEELNPNEGLYLKLAQLGVLRIFTIRGDFENLQGYAVFFVKEDIHYRQLLRATQDLLFIGKEHRALHALKFIKWCDAQMKLEGIQAVYHYVTVARDFSVLLKRIGYEKDSELWIRSL